MVNHGANKGKIPFVVLLELLHKQFVKNRNGLIFCLVLVVEQYFVESVLRARGERSKRAWHVKLSALYTAFTFTMLRRLFLV